MELKCKNVIRTERIEKTKLQVAGIGAGIAVGAFIPGLLLASGMAIGGTVAIGATIIEAGRFGCWIFYRIGPRSDL